MSPKSRVLSALAFSSSQSIVAREAVLGRSSSNLLENTACTSARLANWRWNQRSKFLWEKSTAISSANQIAIRFPSLCLYNFVDAFTLHLVEMLYYCSASSSMPEHPAGRLLQSPLKNSRKTQSRTTQTMTMKMLPLASRRRCLSQIFTCLLLWYSPYATSTCVKQQKATVPTPGIAASDTLCASRLRHCSD